MYRGYNSWTQTSKYILNMLNIDDYLLKNLGFQNAYLGDDGYNKHYDNCIYLRFNNKINVDLLTKNRDDYVIDYELPKKEHMVVFFIPLIYHEDIVNFKEGLYSKLNKEYIISTFDPTDFRYQTCLTPDIRRKELEDSLQVKIDKTKELDTLPIPEKEIYRYDNNKKNW